jgi:uncharacterized protein (DUF362 family)
MSVLPDQLRVGIVRTEQPTYDVGHDPVRMRAMLEQLARTLGWHDDARGPLGAVIRPGERVLLKPNWVLHRNIAGLGTDELITHHSLIIAATEAALEAGASRVIVGDAPVQGCDFERLLAIGSLREWAAALQAREPRFAGIRDFRRTVLASSGEPDAVQRDRVGLDQFVLFDLATDSLLEPVSDGAPFRVTMYPPELMERTHSAGRHQYLVAREVLDADVLINLPKLKTHKKAGVTCALKNLIGINGNKEYLPHHRVGGAGNGGDCYPGANPLKRLLERALDARNSVSATPAAVRRWTTVATVLDRVVRRLGDRMEVEGSWSGNDTIWRTCLDLNRILLYGRVDAGLAHTPQRRVLNLVDAVVIGHGNGPLSPEPAPFGLLLGSESSAATDHVGATLLGYDPARVPITRHAFDQFTFPLVPDTSRTVTVVGDLGAGTAAEVLGSFVAPFDQVRYPLGWIDAVHARWRGRARASDRPSVNAEPVA